MRLIIPVFFFIRAHGSITTAHSFEERHKTFKWLLCHATDTNMMSCGAHSHYQSNDLNEAEIKLSHFDRIFFILTNADCVFVIILY